MPTLEEWFQFYEDSPNILLNIDLKYPSDQYLDQFDIDLYTQAVIDIIDKYDAGKKVILETFSEKVLNSIVKNSPCDREFLLVEDGPYPGTKEFYLAGKIVTILMQVFLPITIPSQIIWLLIYLKTLDVVHGDQLYEGVAISQQYLS